MLDISPVRLIEQLVRLQISYNLCNLPKQITAEDGTLVNYTYFADGTKFKAVDATGNGFVYTGSLRWSVENGALVPESIAITGGRAVFADNSWATNYYITDHLGSVRAVTDAEGEVLGTSDYMPYGSEISSRSNTTTDYRFTGKERQSMVNNSIYDSFARFQNTYGRFMSIDPKAESFYHISPYTYCAGDPVNLVDPDGRMIGDFVNSRGKIIGNDGKDDGKVYIIKIHCSMTFPRSTNGSPYTKRELNSAKKFVKMHSGDVNAFYANPVYYDYFIEIESSPNLRQQMINIVSKDTGNRYLETSLYEYGGSIDNGQIVDVTQSKEKATPGGKVKIKLNYNCDYTFHSHISGETSNGKDTYLYDQYPSQEDIKNLRSDINANYVFGRRCGTGQKVYIYNGLGIQSTVPTKHFVNFK